MTGNSTKRLADRLPDLLIVVLALVLAWLLHQAFCPLIGTLRDDGCYVAYAQALRDGLGYVDPGDPALPVASRYPIGFPALLALVMSGAADWPAAAARLAWVPAVACATFVVSSYLYLRLVAGWRGWFALGGAALLALGNEFWRMGSFLWSDMVFASWGLGALLLAEHALAKQDRRLRTWGLVGGLLLCACLTRYAGLTLALAVVGLLLCRRAWRPLGGVCLSLGLGLLVWGLYRAHVGGEQYVSDFLGLNGKNPLLSGAEALQYMLAGAFPRTLCPGLGLGWLAGAPLALLAGLGAWASLKRGPAAPGYLATLYLLLALLLAVAYQTSFLWFGEELAGRLLLPVAPILLATVAGGGAYVLRLRWPAWAGCVAIAALLVALVVGVVALPINTLTKELLPGDIAEYAGCFAFVQQHVPLGASVLDSNHDMLYLYSGRRSHDLRPILGAGGQLKPPRPIDFLMTLAHWNIGVVVVRQNFFDPSDQIVLATVDFMRAYPGILRPVYVSPGNRCSVLVVRPGPFAALCKAKHIHEINALVEALERANR